MNNSEKLNYIAAIELEGAAPLTDVFAALGRSDSNADDDTFTKEDKYVNLRTTSIRVSSQLLEGFDAVAKRFDLSRTDAFTLAMHTFLDASVNGYIYGCTQAQSDSDDAVKVFLDAREAFIKALDCDEGGKHEVRSSTHNDAVKRAKDFMNVAD